VSFDSTPFERASALCPQPVAVACGRICSARSVQERLDAILKCAEVLTRYVCAVSLASFAARSDPDVLALSAFERFSGALAFGTYLTTVQAVAAAACDHPLKGALAAGFRRRDEQRGVADAALVALLQIRNKHGHDLQGLNRPVAQAIFEGQAPDVQLATALRALYPILRLPLLVVEEQNWRPNCTAARRLILMGEASEPRPENVELAGGLLHQDQLYLGAGKGVINLYPWLLWEYGGPGATFGVYFIDDIGEDKLKYRSVNGDDREEPGSIVGVAKELLAGRPVPMESVKFVSDETFVGEWTKRREKLEHIWRQMRGEIPWDDLDPDTVRWFATKLGAGGTDEALRATLRDRLLSGRDRLEPDELREVCLLFGKENIVRRLLRREMLDCRSRIDPEKRWDDRVEWAGNIFGGLQRAIAFLAEHLDVAEDSLDDLQQTTGSADYVAVREALINCFCHQDYEDPMTTCQIELTPERTTFFNAGKSLVSATDLIEGGKSTRRNPLVAQALRLIRFAELGGSGIRELQRVWRQAGRRPPSFESNAKTNTFTLTLDWRPIPSAIDGFWRRRLGVTINAEEARTLTLATDPAGITREQIASALGVPVNDAIQIADSLIRKALVLDKDGRLVMQEHLKELADEAAAVQWLQQELSRQPQTEAEIARRLAEEQAATGRWHDSALDADRLLRENFLVYDGTEDVPDQLHSYFTSEVDALTDASPQDPELQRVAKNYWYVPDDKSTGDARKVATRDLLAEFDAYREPGAHKHTPFRLEVIRAGFEKAWQEKDYRTIVEVGSRVPEELLQRDPKVTLWYDQAQVRLQAAR